MYTAQVLADRVKIDLKLMGMYSIKIGTYSFVNIVKMYRILRDWSWNQYSNNKLIGF